MIKLKTPPREVSLSLCEDNTKHRIIFSLSSAFCKIWWKPAKTQNKFGGFLEKCYRWLRYFEQILTAAKTSLVVSATAEIPITP